MPRLPHALLVLATLSTHALAGDSDYFLSVPLKGGIWKVDSTTHQASEFASGIGIPFYGFFDGNGEFFVPDRLFGAIFRIDPSGGVHPITAGGFLSSPVAIVNDVLAPNGGIVATDLLQDVVARVSFSGTQTLIHDAATSNGLLNGPGGLDFDPDGNLYVANNLGNTIVKIDPQGAISLFSNSPLIQAPGGVAIDGSGNMFVAMYGTHSIVRFRLDTGEAETFAQDPLLMNRPNDVKLARGGGLLTTTRFANLLAIDSTGQITEIFKDSSFGEIVGVSVPKDYSKCSGRFSNYGAGKPGSGDFVPRMQAIFSPCPGQPIALEWRDFLGGAPALLLFSTAPANQPFLGGSLLVDLSAPNAIVPLVIPGSGPGAGSLRIPFTIDPNPALSGLHFYFQTLAGDPGATNGVSMTAGLHEIIGT